MTPDEAASCFRSGTETVEAWLKARRSHCIETADGLVLICSDSLLGTIGETSDRIRG